MLGKFGIFAVILILVFLFFIVISFGAGLFFWGKVFSKVSKLKQEEIINEKKNIDALSLYWTFLLIVWIAFFFIMYVFNDTVIEWCRALLA